jgi:DNA invertase Pin-like site-specific DNA recombinase
MDDTAKVDDQERICRDHAAARGWDVTQVWKDNNVSAWRRDRKRPGWDAMLAAIETGQVSRVVIYHGDRLIRQPWDLERLIGLAEGKGVSLAAPTGERDLDSAEDRFILRIEAAMACRESDNISRRKKAGFQRMAVGGRAPIPGGMGGRGFGYEKDGATPLEPEATVIRDAADRILDGETLAEICRGIAACGITSTTGKPLTYATLRRVLLRPRTAGLMGDGTRGSWTPLISPQAQREVRKALDARGPRGPITPAGGKYLLSGIALCWACTRPVQVINAGLAGKGIKGYGCVTPGCRKTRRNAAHLDAYVTGRVVALLGTADFTGALQRAQGDGSALAQEIASLEARRGEAQALLGELATRPDLSPALLGRSIRQFDAMIAERQARADTPRLRLLRRNKGISLGQFRSLPLHVRRQIVAACYTITVLPSTVHGPGFNPDDIGMRLRED